MRRNRPLSYTTLRDVMPSPEFLNLACAYKRLLKNRSWSDPVLKSASTFGSGHFVLGAKAHELTFQWFHKRHEFPMCDIPTLEGFDETTLMTLNLIRNRIETCADTEFARFGRGEFVSDKAPAARKKLKYFDICGKLDGRFHQRDGTYHIVDLKTGKSKADHRQAYIYALLCNTDKRFSGKIVFLNLESFEVEEVLVDDDDLHYIQNQLLVAHRTLQRENELLASGRSPDLVYVPNPGRACNVCEFRNLCKYSEHKERGAADDRN